MTKNFQTIQHYHCRAVQVLAYGPPLLARTEESVAASWDILQAATGLDGDGMWVLVEGKPHSLLRSPGPLR